MKMKRNLIAVAVAGLASAVMASSAMAEATAYGLAQVELTSYSNQTEAGTCDVDGTPASGHDGGSDTPCDGLLLQDKANGRVGVKASEDLGNGWTAIAKGEWQVDYADNSGALIYGRESYAGLKSADVEIQAGTLQSAYKYTGGVKYDAFVATALEARRDNGGMLHTTYGQGGFLPETIGVMGKAGAIKWWLTYGLGEGDGDMTASVAFEQDAFEVFVALADKGERTLNIADIEPGVTLGASDDFSATKIGGAYKMGATKFKLQYEMVEVKVVGSTKVEPTYTFIGVEHKLGNNTIVAQLGQADMDDPTSPNRDTDYLALGVIHHFTKMTRLFAGYRTSDADDKSDEDVISVGLRKDF